MKNLNNFIDNNILNDINRLMTPIISAQRSQHFLMLRFHHNEYFFSILNIL